LFFKYVLSVVQFVWFPQAFAHAVLRHLTLLDHTLDDCLTAPASSPTWRLLGLDETLWALRGDLDALDSLWRLLLRADPSLAVSAEGA
jgi:hypothetical protein